MSRSFGDGAQILSIQEMANHFQITSRTLRFYHDMGLLIPIYIDDNTGYRYYSSNQFQRLEKILQMKAIGLPLKQIKAILDTRDLSVFEALLNEQIDFFDEKISELTTSRDALRKQLSSCSHLRNMPKLNTAFIEFIPKREAIVFEIAPYDLTMQYKSINPWQNVTNQVRRTLEKNRLPSTLLAQICCSISMQRLLAADFSVDSALVIGEHVPSSQLSKVTVQSGTFACLYRKYVAMDNRAEYNGLLTLLQYIKEKNYEVVGPYIGEVIANASIFDYSDNDILVKMQIPIKIVD